jgi:hypothetical protein
MVNALLPAAAAEEIGVVALALSAQGETVTETTTGTTGRRTVTEMNEIETVTVMTRGGTGMMMVRIEGGGAVGVQRDAGGVGAGAALEGMTERRSLRKLVPKGMVTLTLSSRMIRRPHLPGQIRYFLSRLSTC